MLGLMTWLGRHQQQRVTVRRRLGGERRAERAAGAAAVIDYDRLAQALVQLLTEYAADNVGAAARRVRHDEPDRSGREVLRRPGGGGQHHRRASEKGDELPSSHRSSTAAHDHANASQAITAAARL
jgi:hypothetical protein